MSLRSITIFGAIALVILNLSAFTINERELAIKLQVGEVVRADYEPGLHFKIPFYQTIRKFPKRIMTINAESRINGRASLRPFGLNPSSTQ